MMAPEESNTLMDSSPIIIIGMHRSGTSMITRVLEELGLFVGDEKQDDHESIFFLNLNDHFLFTIDQYWDRLDETPIPWTKVQIQQLAEVAKRKIKSKQFVHFSRSKESIESFYTPWGWKDPRNTLTFDIWRHMFPKAKVIHIYRNPIDVAVSLKSRYVRSRGLANFIKRMQIKLPRVLQRLNWESRVKHEWDPAKLVDLNCGIDLSKKYLTAAEKISSSLENDRYFELSYESFLEEPLTFIRQIVEFAGLTPSEDELQKSIKKLDVSRKFAFTSDEDLCALYKTIKDEPWMKKLGYSDII